MHFRSTVRESRGVGGRRGGPKILTNKDTATFPHTRLGATVASTRFFMDSSEDYEANTMCSSTCFTPSGGRVYATNGELPAQFQIGPMSPLLRRDPVVLGKPLDPVATSSTILHEPRQAVRRSQVEAIAYPLDRLAACEYRVASTNFWCCMWACRACNRFI